MVLSVQDFSWMNLITLRLNLLRNGSCIDLKVTVYGSLRDCVVMGWTWERNRQTDSKALECGALREVIGKGPWSLKGNLFMVLELLNLIGQRFRSKAFSSACLSRCVDSLVFPQRWLSLWGEGNWFKIVQGQIFYQRILSNIWKASNHFQKRDKKTIIISK